MPKLILQLEDTVLKAYDIGLMATIGRLPDNIVMIDSAAVSGHHACVFRDGDHFVVEDLQSTNGTFVNGTRVSRQALQHGDVVRVGKHQLVLDQVAVAEAVVGVGEDPAVPNHGETMFIGAKTMLGRLVGTGAHRKYDALAARLMDVEAHASIAKVASRESAAERTDAAILRVVAGRADQSEYRLEGHTTLIGKSKSSAVLLRGWFKPKMAVAITRNRQGYVATLLGGYMLIKGQSVSGRHELNDGDVLDVCGLVLEFCSMKQEIADRENYRPSHSSFLHQE